MPLGERDPWTAVDSADSCQQKEMWTETPVHNGKKGRPVNKDRFISKM